MSYSLQLLREAVELQGVVISMRRSRDLVRERVRAFEVDFVNTLVQERILAVRLRLLKRS